MARTENFHFAVDGRFMHRRSHKVLAVFPLPFNPYKLIFRVLNYAWKHKCPERRSALTYWVEDIPSCIDLGMSKYGGPFVAKEVQDVKTFLIIARSTLWSRM